MATETEVATLPQYRSISGLSVLALVLGIVSPLALVNPVLLALPLVAMFVALLALHRISANPDTLSGSRLAIAGLLIAVFLLSFTPVRLWMRHRVLSGHAVQLADAFLELMQQGKLYEAHQLMHMKYVNMDPSVSLDDMYANDKRMAEDLEQFMENASLKRLQSLDRKFTFRFERFEPATGYPNHDMIVMRYHIQPDASLRNEPFPMEIGVSRTVDEKTHLPEWRLNTVH